MMKERGEIQRAFDAVKQTSANSAEMNKLEEELNAHKSQLESRAEEVDRIKADMQKR